jgi:hypothetical protein
MVEIKIIGPQNKKWLSDRCSDLPNPRSNIPVILPIESRQSNQVELYYRLVHIKVIYTIIYTKVFIYTIIYIYFIYTIIHIYYNSYIL